MSNPFRLIILDYSKMVWLFRSVLLSVLLVVIIFPVEYTRTREENYAMKSQETGSSIEMALDKHKITVHFSILEQNVNASDMISALMGTEIKDHLHEIFTTENSHGKPAAMRLLLEKILHYDTVDIYQGFYRSLENNEYKLIIDVINGTHSMEDQKVFQHMVHLFCEKLHKNMIPTDILPALQADGCLNNGDYEEITSLVNQKGNRMASLGLLFAVTKKKADWFPCFMWALKCNGLDHIVKEIDSLFGTAVDLPHMKKLCDVWRTSQELKLSSSHESQLQFMDTEESIDLDSAPSGSNQAPGESFEYNGSKTVPIAAVKPQNAQDWLVDLGEEDDEPDGAAGLLDFKADDTSDMPHRDPQPLNLRNYQEELAEQASQGENRIIVAPTGSGKTHVAMAIAKAHFSRVPEGRMVFIVPTTALVEQQKRQFETYLAQRVIGICGENSAGGNMAIELLLTEQNPAYQIFVLTPQILIDSLKRESGLASLAEFTLIIFDECHHCMKDHPYNVIMNMYHEEKSKKNAQLPQVVGLTASVGVGKARMVDQAVEHILNLCANMDCKISTVQRYRESLEEHINKPGEEKCLVRGRSFDPFGDTINRLMERVERMMNTETDGTPLMEEVEKRIKKSKARDEQQYTQWVAAVENEVARLRDQGTKPRKIYACVRQLRYYHEALLINSDCRTKDAVDYILNEFMNFKQRQSQAVVDDYDEKLLKMFTDIEPKLREMMNDRRVANPKLEKLKEIMLEKYRENKDTKGILFCKTRALTVALETWINEDDDLKNLRPKRLVGSNAPAKQKGMTQNDQEKVLQYFRDGRHHLIIATTVAEEGLDISTCNLVIRYEHVTNETARIQTKGRARADNADFILVAGGKAINKEDVNMIRERMMHEALERIVRMSDDIFQQYIQTLQSAARMERRMKNAVQQRKLATPRVAAPQLQLRCKKCNNLACTANYVKRIQDAHYVNTDPLFYRQARVILQETFQDYGGDFVRAGKLWCEACGEDWGMQAIYKRVPLPVIKIVNFKVVNPEDRSSAAYKKWKDVPFQVDPISEEDLKRANDSAQELLGTPIRERLLHDQ